MISIEKRLFIRDEISLLLNNIEKTDVKIVDRKFPSLSVWSYYEMFLNALTNQYFLPAENKEDYEIFELLELDGFYVNACEDSNISKKKIREYSDRIIKKLKL